MTVPRCMSIHEEIRAYWSQLVRDVEDEAARPRKSELRPERPAAVERFSPWSPRPRALESRPASRA